MHYKTIIAFLFLLFISSYTQAQESTVTIAFDGIQANEAYIGMYYGNKKNLVDTSRLDSVTYTFKFGLDGKEPGMYYFATPRFQIFDFIIPDSSGSFMLTGSAKSPDSMKAFQSTENAIYFEYLAAAREKQAKIGSLRTQLNMIKGATRDSIVLNQLESNIQRATQELVLTTSLYIQKYPKSLVSKMLKSVQFPKAPLDLPVFLPNGETNPAHFKWMQNHFWDKNDFKDPRLLRNNLWVSYLNAYLQRFTETQPDSINRAIDRLLDKMPPYEAFYTFTVEYVTETFETSDWFAADQVFVHMVDTYLPNDSTAWLDEATLLRLKDKADFHRPNLTGQKAPPLRLSTPDGKWISLDSLQSDYFMLVFYSPLCGHCMDAMPDIYQTYLDARPYGLEALAISVDRKFDDWKTFTEQQSWEWYNVADPSNKLAFQEAYGAYNLPVIYLLDKNKRIVMKRVRPEKLNASLNYLMKQK
jgi:peroxiredoxin